MGLDLGLGSGSVNIQYSKNTPDLIADALRSAILQGRLKEGQALRQDEIAAAFKVSKIPVREALVQLQSEGLVRLNKNRGAVVSTLTFNEVEEIYTMRLALEPIALRRAIPKMRASDFVQAEHILNKINHTADHRTWAELNWEFHESLYIPAQMPHLIQTVREFHNNVVRFLVHYIKDDQLAKSQAQHRDLLALCRAGDVEAACTLLHQHLQDPPTLFAKNFPPDQG